MRPTRPVGRGHGHALRASAVLVLWVGGAARANDDGVVGFSRSGCVDCHGETASPSVSVELQAGATSVTGGETVELSLTVRSTDPAHTAAGLDVSATAGTLVPSATLLWRKGELTHQFPHDTTDGERRFDFTWTAPAWAAEVTIAAAGNAVDADGSAHGDGWGTDTLVLSVVSECMDGDGDQVGDCEGDCDDADPAVYPGAAETWYDGVDSDCAGDDDDDADGDGTPAPADCDDADPAVAAAGDCDSGQAGDGGEADGGTPSQPAQPPPKGCQAGGGAPVLGWALLAVALGRRRAQAR